MIKIKPPSPPKKTLLTRQYNTNEKLTNFTQEDKEEARAQREREGGGYQAFATNPPFIFLRLFP
jgi:hypothetical protein